MTWSIELTFWALPPLLAVLVVLRDLGYLVPRRRELGTRTLMGLLASAGIWSTLDLVAVVSPSLDVKTTLALAEYLPAAAVLVCWPWFALVYAGRRKLRRWPMLVLLGAVLAATGSVLRWAPAWLIRNPTLVGVGAVTGLEVSLGVGSWVFLVAQVLSVGWGAWILSRHDTRTVARNRRWGVAALAGVLGVAPSLYHVLVAYGHQWSDLTSSGFALGASLLSWGLLRPRLLDLGPVDRTRVLHELHDPIVVMDGKGRIVDVNRAAERDLGLQPYGDVPLELGTVWAAGLSETRGPAKVRVQLPGQEERIFEVTLTPLGDRGTAVRSALLLRDISARETMRLQLHRANRELKRLAHEDALTGLANRRSFMDALEREVERSDRYTRPLSLVLLDMDFFKQVNDTHGHAAGDDVLRSAAGVLRSVCRDVDLAARLGGEELALLLPETDAAGAATVAERVRTRMESATHESPAGQTFTVTASIGVASVPAGTKSGTALLQAADEALYRAKGGGRNRVVMSASSE
jgi:diguanylate cyclase (GGDEF)-like protein